MFPINRVCSLSEKTIIYSFAHVKICHEIPFDTRHLVDNHPKQFQRRSSEIHQPEISIAYGGHAC
jgi:hypothetical protein